MVRLFNILFLVTLVGIAGCESREEARRKQVANNLKQIGLALEAYHGKSAGPTSRNRHRKSESKGSNHQYVHGSSLNISTPSRNCTPTSPLLPRWMTLPLPRK